MSELFGKYELIRKIASGGMAEVFLAKQTGEIGGFSKKVAIKRIFPHMADDPDAKHAFYDEARIAARFNHPNIVQIYDLGQTGDNLFIAMEYVHGRDLKRVVERAKETHNPLPINMAVTIVAASAAGLAYAHRQCDEDGNPMNVVHRDVSPQNVLVSADGHVKLCDFGIVKAENRLQHTKEGQFKGKLAYMSPEQFDTTKLDHRADIYSLGVVLYEATTGQKLYMGDTDMETMALMHSGTYQTPSQVSSGYPADLEAIVLQAINQAPDSRFQTAEELQLALENWLDSNQARASAVHISRYVRTLFPELENPITTTGELAAIKPADQTQVTSEDQIEDEFSVGPTVLVEHTPSDDEHRVLISRDFQAEADAHEYGDDPTAMIPEDELEKKRAEWAGNELPTVIVDQTGLESGDETMPMDRPEGLTLPGAPREDAPGPPVSSLPGPPIATLPKPPAAQAVAAPMPAAVASIPAPAAVIPAPAVAPIPGPVAQMPGPVAQTPSPVAQMPGPVAPKPGAAPSPVAPMPGPAAAQNAPVAPVPGPRAAGPPGSNHAPMRAASAPGATVEPNTFAPADVSVEDWTPSRGKGGMYAVLGLFGFVGVLALVFAINASDENELKKEAEALRVDPKMLEDDAQPELETVVVPFESQPAGAHFVVNGLPADRDGNGLRLRKGVRNEVTAVMSGHRPGRVSVEGTSASSPYTIELIPLEDAKKVASLSIMTEPREARIWLNGKDMGMTPTTLNDLRADIEHHVYLEKEGRFGYVGFIRLVPGVENQIKADLPAEDSARKNYVDVILSAVPRGTLAYINGETSGATPFSKNMTRGEFLNIEFDEPDHRPMKRALSLERVGTMELRPFLEPMKREKGTIAVAIQPSGGTIFIKNNEYGQGPVDKLELKEGKVPVVVEHLGMRLRTVVEVLPGEHVSYTLVINGDQIDVQRR